MPSEWPSRRKTRPSSPRVLLRGSENVPWLVPDTEHKKHVLKMKSNPFIRRPPICLAAVLLLAAGATTTALAAAPLLQGNVISRPLTPGDKTVYGLASSLDVSGGLTTVGVGTAVYLEAEINKAVPAADIVSVTWELTNKSDRSHVVL